jgi:hypothetical protein
MKYSASLSLILILSLNASAATVLCVSTDYKITIESRSKNDIKVSYNGESAFADGLLSSEEVDIVAKFSSIGEMTLFAKIGKSHPDNYLFIKGKRFSVNCR